MFNGCDHTTLPHQLSLSKATRTPALLLSADTFFQSGFLSLPRSPSLTPSMDSAELPSHHTAMRPTFTSRTRRPSRISHRANLEAEFRRKKNPIMVPDGDTFYYNPAFLPEWSMPADLWARLPTELTTELGAWQAAGAAVTTVLTRIDQLDAEAHYRGWPERTMTHLSRTTSHVSPEMQSPILPRLDTLSEGKVSPLPSCRAKLNVATGKDATPMSAILDTPPFTPQDSLVHHEFSLDPTVASTPNQDADLDQVSSRLANMASLRSGDDKVLHMSPTMTPISRRSSAESESMQPIFDESAWDVYINSYKAELTHLRREDLVRFRHLGHAIDRLWTDLEHDSGNHLLQGAGIEFVTWWKQMTDKAQEYESEVKMLELPDLVQVKLERVANGLTI